MLVIQDDIVDANSRTGRHLFAMSKGKVCLIKFDIQKPKECGTQQFFSMNAFIFNIFLI